MENERLDALVRTVLNGAHKVSRGLGPGFLEKVYENALTWELRKDRVSVAQQSPLCVIYDGRAVGEYVADLVVEDALLVEIKACTSIARAHRLQCLNYLRACDLRLGVVLNFGNPRLEIARVANRF